ncbi:MAG: hypothetical protein J6J36_08120 [Clostridia bacterium]|nr:hypothetical protein [Clostridia bacterium]MBP3708539.1 hypothetical protein [Clostridia bacterium]
MSRKKEPVRLYPKKEKRAFKINALFIGLILFLIVFIIAIALAISCTSPYNMVWA